MQVDYQIKPEHYAKVALSLIYTLGAGLGDDFTEEVKNAWVKTYTILADTMKKAAY